MGNVEGPKKYSRIIGRLPGSWHQQGTIMEKELTAQRVARDTVMSTSVLLADSFFLPYPLAQNPS